MANTGIVLLEVFFSSFDSEGVCPRVCMYVLLLLWRPMVNGKRVEFGWEFRCRLGDDTGLVGKVLRLLQIKLSRIIAKDVAAATDA